MKPRIFIGSSSRQIPLVEAMATELAGQTSPVPWHSNGFAPSSLTLDALLDHTRGVQFALLIFGHDDSVRRSGGKSWKPAPRDNVVYEAGLFAGSLGVERTLILYAEDVTLPTDLLGLTTIRFGPTAPVSETAGMAAARVLRHIAEVSKGSLEGRWWQYSYGQDDVEQAVVSDLLIRRRDLRYDIAGRAWQGDGAPLAQFRSTTSHYTSGSRPALQYGWEGEWPVLPGAPRFYGVGEIILDAPMRASGYFTVRSDDEAFKTRTSRITTQYFRMEAHEVEALDAEDPIAEADAVRRRLDEYRSWRFKLA